MTLSFKEEYQSFWDFWTKSPARKAVAIILGLAAFSTVLYPILGQGYKTIEKKEIYGTNTSSVTITSNTQTKIDNSYLLVLGAVIFILLLPEIKRAKIDSLELETSHQPLSIPTKLSI